MGNWVVGNPKGPRAEGNAGGQNVTDLRPRFTAANYLTPHSDLVALMVFEHQAEGHTRLARAMIEGRQARHDQAGLNRDLGEPAGREWESVTRRVEAAAEQLVRHLLFEGEARLGGPVAGTSGFADESAAGGPTPPCTRP